MHGVICAAILLAMAGGGAAEAAQARRSAFGTLPDGRAVEAVTLSNRHGVRARILSYGAILQALEVPDREGRSADVVLGYADLRGYLDNPAYLGSTVGRYANRIAGGRFTLDGRTYQLATNDGPNALHGGVRGFNKRLWTIEQVKSGPVASVTLAYVSPDGEEGYPGTLHVSATYSLDEQGALSIEYRATTDKPTIVNITNHSYFNLAGEASQRSILDERLMIPAEAITPVGKTQIPTGEFRPVAGTLFDFRRPTEIGLRIRDGRDPQIVFGRGYDHNFVLARAPTRAVHLAARLEDPVSGRVLELLTNQPGVQLYTGNSLDGSIVGKSGHSYRQGDGLALEAEQFPDTPNHPAFGSARLDPGQTYLSRIVYRFSTVR